jgi:hypothetical protein
MRRRSIDTVASLALLHAIEKEDVGLPKVDETPPGPIARTSFVGAAVSMLAVKDR